MTRVELVDELVRLAERFWGDGYVEAASCATAMQVHALLAHVDIDCVRPYAGEYGAGLVALIADGADDARRRFLCVPFDVDECQSDLDTAKPAPEVEASLKAGQAVVLRGKFALEFSVLAFEFFRPTLGRGAVGYECRDFSAAKELAEALKPLAELADKAEDVREIVDAEAHGVIIAYERAAATSRLREVAAETPNSGDFFKEGEKMERRNMVSLVKSDGRRVLVDAADVLHAEERDVAGGDGVVRPSVVLSLRSGGGFAVATPMDEVARLLRAAGGGAEGRR